jgi:iron complex outermembrane recepter protein
MSRSAKICRAPYWLGAVSVIALAVPAAHAQSTAQAQPAPTADAADAAAPDIVVTGFRSSLAEALKEKRDAVNTVDVILAEDIADFPDLNLAESIQRIPGVSIDRDNGEGRTITVRGLNPDFTRVRINGMETLATTGSTDASGGTNRGRGFDFNTFASELFRSIKVSKSPTPQTEEGSLGAVVDLSTGRPLDYDRFALAASAQGQYNETSDKLNPRLAGLVSLSNDAKTLGALVSVSYTQRDIIEEGFSTVRYAGNPAPAAGAAQNFTQRNAFQNEAAFPQAATAFFPRIPRYGVNTSDQERIGVTAAFQAAPSDKTLISLDLLYSKFSGSRQEQFLEAISFSRNNATGIRETDLVSLTVDPATRNIISGTFNDVDVRIENRIDDLKTVFKQGTLEVTQKFSDKFSARVLGGISESDFKVGRQTTIIADALNVDGYSIDFSQNRLLPSINYNINVTNPANFTVNEVRDRPQSTVNKFKTGVLDLNFEANDTFSVQSGFSFKRFDFAATEARRDTILATAAQFPLTAANSTLVSLTSSLNTPSGVDRTFVTPDIDSIAAAVGLYTGNFPLVVQRDAVNDVRESDYAGYLQGSLRAELGAVKIRAVAGLRYVRTEVIANGLTTQTLADPDGPGPMVAPTVTVPVRATNNYDDYLPSVSLTLEPSDKLLVRASFAKQMARPTLNSLTPGGAFNPFNSTLSFGNPRLLPFRADSYDLGAEWYFAKESLISVGLFYKKIKTFVTRTTESVPFRDLGLDPALLVGTPSSIDDIFTVTRNINGEGGKLKGIEMQYQQPFFFLPGVLNNFGFIGNVTLIDSKVNYGTTLAPRRDQLLNLSKQAFNATLYYEDKKFSARISGAYRSKFLTRVPGQNGSTTAPLENDVEGTNSTFNVDAALSYALTDKIRLTLEGINLTDEFRNQFIDSAGDRPVTNTHTGRSVLFGARFTL